MLLLWYAVASALTFGLYLVDKHRARRDARRISERTLHLSELVGGWPGGVLGRSLVRHKTRKRTFRLISWAICTAHLAGLAAWAALERGWTP